MNDEQLKQRIAYLIENGVVDDPLDIVNKRMQRLAWLVGATIGADVLIVATMLV